MSGELRVKVGATVLCNLGPSGWKLGRVIALHYREEHWPEGRTAPYQVALEADHALIYVPVDDAQYCREPSPEDLRIARRMDALAALPEASERRGPPGTERGCASQVSPPGAPGYRHGRCHCCDRCPRSWSAVELYSEHYRCAALNGRRVTRRAVDLGTVRVGDAMAHAAGAEGEGMLQCPTLVRLPPGVRFSDGGSLAGEVRHDPHQGASYRVDFVAVSTAAWDDPAVGIVRLEITFVVEGNEPPAAFDARAFEHAQQEARASAARLLRGLGDTWERFEQGTLGHRETIDGMLADLRQLRALLERHPRLDEGRWWAHLGGYHMNVHKLLENTLFECELYLGHALTFGSAEVRSLAEVNLEGCYQKRVLEAARFLWIEGTEQMMRGEWAAAAETLRRGAALKDGWGWAVNYGDLWMSEAAARMIHGAERAADEEWVAEAARLLEQAAERAEETFGAEGHPWASELDAALAAYEGPSAAWLARLKERTVYWCAQVLAGAPPFPPQPQPRLEDAGELVRRLRGLDA